MITAVASTGWCSMLSLHAHLICSPAEDSHTFQGHTFHAQRAKKAAQWRLGTQTVRLMVDVEGSVETARQNARNCGRSEG